MNVVSFVKILDINLLLHVALISDNFHGSAFFEVHFKTFKLLFTKEMVETKIVKHFTNHNCFFSCLLVFDRSTCAFYFMLELFLATLHIIAFMKLKLKYYSS